METLPEIIAKVSFSGQAMADLVFFLTAGFSAVVSLILFFHWRKYGMGGPSLAIAEFVYLGVSAALLTVAFFSLK